MKLPTSLLPLVALILSSAPAPSSASSVSPGLSQAKPGSKLAKNVLTSTSERGYCSVRPPLRRVSSSVILLSIGECSITISSPHASKPRPKDHLHKTLKPYSLPPFHLSFFDDLLLLPASHFFPHLPLQTKPQPSSSSQPSGQIEHTLCRYETLESVNSEGGLYESLHKLVEYPFFRLYKVRPPPPPPHRWMQVRSSQPKRVYLWWRKVDLFKECPFWYENTFCMNRDCSVETADEVRPPLPFSLSLRSSHSLRPVRRVRLADPVPSHIWRDVEQSEVPEKWRTASQSLSSLGYSSEHAAVVGPLPFFFRRSFRLSPSSWPRFL